MEENVALDTSKQKKFVKSIKGIKKLLKKKQLASTEQQPEPITVKPKVKHGKKKKIIRGLVYLSHIPHGFYEEQMAEYFKQFGTVTNVRVIRSKRTGRSKGHAFVEFKQPAVAEIVAETMNNYLMGKRLIKAAYIPPEKIRLRAKRKNWTTLYNPSAQERIKQKRAYNAHKTDEETLKQAQKRLANLNKTKQKLSELGINYDFFTPVDIPEGLTEIKLEKEDVPIVKVYPVVKSKSKKKKNKATANKEEVVNTEPEPNAIDTVKAEDIQPKVEKMNKKTKKAKAQEVKKVNLKFEHRDVIKNENVKKPLEDFVEVPHNSDTDDSSVEFDSDEFEKMLENESDSDSSPDNKQEFGDSDSEESVIDIPPTKPNAATKAAKSVQTHKNKKSKQDEQKKNTSPQMKRKASTSVATADEGNKKPKFEKKGKGKQISTKKQFKKKK